MYPEHEPPTYELGQVSYLLTTKGYDVALKLQEHRDQEERFSEQQNLTQQSVNIAASSRKVARTAVCVAAFIAFGSIGNLGMNFFSNYSGNNGLNVQSTELTNRDTDILEQSIEVKPTTIEKTVGASQTKAVSAEVNFYDTRAIYALPNINTPLRISL